MKRKYLFTSLITILSSILFLSCGDGKNENRKEEEKIELSEKPNVFYGVENINKEDTFSIYSPDTHEKFTNLKRTITFFFENDTLKLFTGLFGIYETIEINGFIVNNRIKFNVVYSECTHQIDSMVIFTSEARFSNKVIKPDENYCVEFNIHARLVGDYDSIEVFACGSFSGTIHPSPPKYILDRREWEKQNKELVGR